MTKPMKKKVHLRLSKQAFKYVTEHVSERVQTRVQWDIKQPGLRQISAYLWEEVGSAAMDHFND